jgi:hypothetical protein
MKEKKFNYVYLTINLINGKQYIGDRSTDEINNSYDKGYIGSGRPYFKNAIKKYGRKNFKKEILEFFDTKQQAFDAQEKYIKQFNTLYPYGYNISLSSGFLCRGSHSKESIEKIRVKHKGKKQTKEHIEKRSIARSGYCVSNESKEKNRLSHLGKISGFKGKHHSKESKEKLRISHLGNQFRKGKKHSVESIEKMRKIKLGKIVTVETRNKLSNLLKGKKRSLETKQKISDANKHRIKTFIKCEYCKKSISKMNYYRWHGLKCKFKI